MPSIWTDLYKRSSFESNALWEKSFLQDFTRWLEAPLQSCCPSALAYSPGRERPKDGEAGWLGGGWAVCFPCCVHFFLGKYCTRPTLSPLNTAGRGGKAGGLNSKRDQSTMANTVLTDCFKDGGKALSLFHDCVQSYVPQPLPQGVAGFMREPLILQVPLPSLW